MTRWRCPTHTFSQTHIRIFVWACTRAKFGFAGGEFAMDHSGSDTINATIRQKNKKIKICHAQFII